MAVYTELSLGEINAFLSSYEVGACIHFSVLADGTTNSNYLIKTLSNQYVLTVFEEVDHVDFLRWVYKTLLTKSFPSATLIKPNHHYPKIKQKPALLVSFR